MTPCEGLLCLLGQGSQGYGKEVIFKTSTTQQPTTY